MCKVTSLAFKTQNSKNNLKGRISITARFKQTLTKITYPSIL